MKKIPNKLINETSPYLLQHAYNPVNWFPWGEEALTKAKKHDKPIFLSIGYSTCHWCHVMEKESFENKEIASFLNENFISIKVDREERTDLDSVYMKFAILQTGQGGWPLNVFLTPNQEPFYAGMYFPSREKMGMPSFLTILNFVRESYQKNKAAIPKNTEQLKRIFQQKSQSRDLTLKPIEKSNELFNNFYDEKNGGFQGSPKFPITLSLLFNLYQKKNLDKVEHTLRKMGNGGIYDHLGGGFSRYSTDEYWLVPHFEKTLYDNALLLIAYSQCFIQSKNKYFKEKADGIFDYLISNLLSENGFYSGQDADSEGEEGTFYIFAYDEIKKIVGDIGSFSEYFNIIKYGNFEGKNILNVNPNLKKTEKIEKDRIKLLNYRNKRIKPNIDTKIITSWNSLTISSFLIYGNLCNNEYAINLAEKILNKILKGCLKEKKLLRIYGKENLTGFLEDYSFLINALLDAYETTLKEIYLEKAKDLAEISIKLFYTETFSNLSELNEKLFIDVSDMEDNVMPSGISMILFSLFKLNEVIHNDKYEKIIESFLKENMEKMEKNPLNFQLSLQVLYSKLNGFYSIEINGDRSFVMDSHSKLIKSTIFNKIIYEKKSKKNFLKVCYKNSCNEYKTAEEFLETKRNIN